MAFKKKLLRRVRKYGLGSLICFWMSRYFQGLTEGIDVIYLNKNEKTE